MKHLVPVFMMLATILAAQVEGSAEKYVLLSQQEAQLKFSQIVADADRIVVGAHLRTSDYAAFVPFWGTSDNMEIKSICASFVLKIPPPRIETIDGIDQPVYEGFGCGCYGSFQVAFFKEKTELLSLVIFHGESIAAKALSEWSQIRVDKDRLAEFYKRMTSLKNKAKANQALQTMPGRGPPSKRRPRPGMADL